MWNSLLPPKKQIDGKSLYRQDFKKGESHYTIWFSYDTPIAVVINENNRPREAYITTKKYSTTTSRHINLVIEEISLSSEWLHLVEEHEIFAKGEFLYGMHILKGNAQQIGEL